MDYEQDIFYDTRKLTVKQKKNLLINAKELCYKWNVDRLDCSESWQRKTIEMSFDEIMKKFNNSCHFVVINRKEISSLEKEHGEIGFSTMTLIDYFLWIELDMNNFNKLIKKYNLIKRV